MSYFVLYTSCTLNEGRFLYSFTEIFPVNWGYKNILRLKFMVSLE